jgi:hypothetical protein
VTSALSDEDYVALINGEPDAFRLTIRGHAALEDKLDIVLAEAFVGGDAGMAQVAARQEKGGAVDRSWLGGARIQGPDDAA